MKLNLLNNVILATSAIVSNNTVVEVPKKENIANVMFELNENDFNLDYYSRIKKVESFISKIKDIKISYFVSEYTNFVFFDIFNITSQEKEKIIKEIEEYFNIKEIHVKNKSLRKSNDSKKEKPFSTKYKKELDKNNDTFNVMNLNNNEREILLKYFENKKNYGERVKVGILDDGKIEKKSDYFSDEKDIHLIENKSRFWWFNNNFGDHATKVASVIGGINGINPYTHLYGIRSFSYNGAGHEIEWLMNNGVKVINLSYYLSQETDYNWASRYLDSLSQNTKKEVTFVIASGNLENDEYTDVYKKGLLGDGLSYNSILVGAIRNSDFLEEFSSWRSKTGKKINVVAPDGFIVGNDTLNGTSFSAPAVAGIISILMELEKDAYRKGLDSIITMSALTASSNPNIWTIDESGNYEHSKKELHDHYGPGKIDYVKMREALQNLEYRIVNNGNSSDDMIFKKINLNKGDKISVGLSWNYNLKFKKDGLPHVHDFDLKITGPNNFLKKSQKINNNYERVIFEAPESGEYIFRVSPYEKVSGSDEFHIALSFARF